MVRIEKTKKDYGIGNALLLSAIFFLFCLISLRLWYFQILNGAELLEKAHSNRFREEMIYAPRGLIFDRNGILLASNEPSYSLVLIREDCPDIKKTLKQIHSWTGIELKILQKKYEKNKKNVRPFQGQIIVSNIPFTLLPRIEAELIYWPGLKIIATPYRHYKYSSLFSHIIGYVALANESELEKNPNLDMGDNIGKQGVELTYEKELRGIKGQENHEVDASGRILSLQLSSLPQAGENLHLSIDLALQKAATQAIGDKTGAVVVMEATSGQILALVSSPNYDTNLFTHGISEEKWQELLNNPYHPLQNRPLQNIYPLASVYKLVVAGCGLQDKMISPATKFFCSGAYKLGNRFFRCWKKYGHGEVNLERSLVESCDVYYYKLGEQLGVDKIYNFSKQCGFGEKTGIDLPHEREGLVPNKEWKKNRTGQDWQSGETLILSIGQGYLLVSPLQVARFIAALVNGGDLLKPELNALKEPTVQGKIPIDDATRTILQKTMVATVTKIKGTAKRLYMPGMIIGAKTGTAQVVKLMDKYKDKKTEEIPYQYRDHAWIASWGFLDGKYYVVVVFVEHGGSGGAGAGPVAKVVYDKIFNLYYKPESKLKN